MRRACIRRACLPHPARHRRRCSGRCRCSRTTPTPAISACQFRRPRCGLSGPRARLRLRRAPSTLPAATTMPAPITSSGRRLAHQHGRPAGGRGGGRAGTIVGRSDGNFDRSCAAGRRRLERGLRAPRRRRHDLVRPPQERQRDAQGTGRERGRGRIPRLLSAAPVPLPRHLHFELHDAAGGWSTRATATATRAPERWAEPQAYEDRHQQPQPAHGSAGDAGLRHGRPARLRRRICTTPAWSPRPGLLRHGQLPRPAPRRTQRAAAASPPTVACTRNGAST